MFFGSWLVLFEFRAFCVCMAADEVVVVVDFVQGARAGNIYGEVNEKYHRVN